MRNCGSVRHGSVDKQSRRHHHRDTVAQPVMSRGRCLPPAPRTFIFFGTSEKLAGHCSEGSEGHRRPEMNRVNWHAPEAAGDMRRSVSLTWDELRSQCHANRLAGKNSVVEWDMTHYLKSGFCALPEIKCSHALGEAAES